MMDRLKTVYPTKTTFCGGYKNEMKSVKRCAAQKSGTSLYNLSSKLREHGRHTMLSFLSSLPIPVLRVLDIEANRFYDRNHQMHRVQSLHRKRGRNTGIVVVSRRIAVDSPPFWWKII